MDDAMIFSTHKQNFEDLANLSKAFIKFELKISSHKCHFREDFIYVSIIFMLRD